MIMPDSFENFFDSAVDVATVGGGVGAKAACPLRGPTVRPVDPSLQTIDGVSMVTRI